MKTFSTKNEKVKLIIVGYDEPNYGRELNIVRVEQEGIDITKKLEPNWNRICFNLDKFEFTKNGLNFCYLPFESGDTLYNYDSTKVQIFKHGPIASAHRRFIGNRFSNSQLIVVYDRLLKMIHLKTGKVRNIESKENERFNWIEFIDDNTVEVSIWEIKIRGNIMDRIGEKKTQYNNTYN